MSQPNRTNGVSCGLTGVVAGAVVAMLPASPVVADMTGAIVDDVTAEIATAPPGCTVLRISLLFDDPNDTLLAVGPEDGGQLLSFHTTCGGGIHNDGGGVSGLKLEDFPAAPLSAAHDSWLTIGDDLTLSNETDYPPRFLNTDGVHAVVLESSWSDDDAGWFDSNPGTPAHPDATGRVLIAQFTVCDDCCSITLSGCAKWTDVDGTIGYTTFTTSGRAPCPNGGACCTDQGCMVTIEPTCDDLGGVFLGIDTTCSASSCPGACCFGDGSCTIGGVNDCVLAGGLFLGSGVSCAEAFCPSAPACPADLDASTAVGFEDLVIVLGNWGACGATCPADIDASGDVGFGDLVTVLSSWGPCEDLPVGACCLAGSTCQLLDVYDCLAAGGGYLGDGTICSASVCIIDCNGNGVADAVDISSGASGDCNSDGIPDDCQDCDGNGIADGCDLLAGATDCNRNGVLDDCELDCNDNGIADACDIQSGVLHDCDDDGLPDECYLGALDNELGLEDCNGNGIPDGCELASGFEPDCNDNGILDACEPDCNGNGIPDDCDIEINMTSADCNVDGVPDECQLDCDGNGIPDDCDILLGTHDDRNRNGVPDLCDIAGGASLDQDGNGIPDESQPPDAASPLDYLLGVDPGLDEPVTSWWSFADAPLPAGFFAPDSLPFDGTVPLARVLIDPMQLGGTSVILQRSADPFSPADPPGGPAQVVDVTVLASHFAGAMLLPIDGAVETELWSMSVQLSALPQPVGTVTAIKTHANGGTYDLELPILPRLVFRRASDPMDVRIIDYGIEQLAPVVFTATDIGWVHDVDPNLYAQIDATSGFVGGVHEESRTGEQTRETIPLESPLDEAALPIDLGSLTSVDLTIHNGLAGACTESRPKICGGHVIEDSLEVTRGAVTVANLNDTDGDDIIDNQDLVVVPPDTRGRPEHDLMELILHRPVFDFGGHVELTLERGDARVWILPTKQFEMTLPLQVPTSNLPASLWVEAPTVSQELRDIGFKLTYLGQEDEVAATAAWATFKQAKHVNAISGPDNAIPDDVGPPLFEDDDDGTIFEMRPDDGSNFGLGPFWYAPKGIRAMGGRILFEFTTEPAGVESLGVRWDITRQKKRRVRRVGTGTGVLEEVTQGDGEAPDLDFPYELDPPQDTEEPNDDNSRKSDEDNTPTNQRIYSFDTPAIQLDSSVKIGGKIPDFHLRRYQFREWARVRIAAPDRPTSTHGDFKNRDHVVEGSRSSEKVNWRFVTYLRAGVGNQFELVTGSPSVSHPHQTLKEVRGTAHAAVLPGAVNEGFTATYSNGAHRWTVTGTSGSTAMSNVTPTGPWTVTVDNKVNVTFTLTDVSRQFKDNTRFQFSTFRTARPARDASVIELGTVDLSHGF